MIEYIFDFFNPETAKLRKITKQWNIINDWMYKWQLIRAKEELLKIETEEHKDKIELWIYIIDSLLWK